MILAFDTSAAHCAAALLCQGADGTERVILREEAMQKGQAERLVRLLEEVLAEAGTDWEALDALAVGIGPGNFTGVRIAVATARGLALGLGVPAIGVTRLEALAYGLPHPLRVIEDARRGMVYVQDFPKDGAPNPPELREIEAVTACAHPATGSAAGAEALPPALPLAEAIARIALSRIDLPNLPRPAPYYLRAADAAPPADPPPVILDAPAS